MALAHWQKTFTDTSGNVRAGLSVEIRDESTGAIAAIYEDIEGDTPKSNPLTTDEFGYANFYAADGRYRIQATGVDWRNEAVLTAANVIAAQVAAEEAQQGAELARDSAGDLLEIAQASANFKGAWSDQSGSASIPTSVFHLGGYWALMTDLANIATEEPGASSAWAFISRGERTQTFGPGPQQLIAGDMTDGFFGEVSAGELFSGDELAFIAGVTEGVAQNSDAGWLKFACDGKILFVAKQAFRRSISWGHLYSRGVVYGTDDNGANPSGTATNQLTTVRVLGYTFKVRLMTGGNADPVDVSDDRFFTDDMVQLDLGGGSEWNRLMYRVHQDVPTDDDTDGMNAHRHGGPQVGANWASYKNGDLNIDGNGRSSWCQETTTDSSGRRVFRGNEDVAHFSRGANSNTNSSYGWRPALELITNH